MSEITNLELTNRVKRERREQLRKVRMRMISQKNRVRNQEVSRKIKWMAHRQKEGIQCRQESRELSNSRERVRK